MNTETALTQALLQAWRSRQPLDTATAIRLAPADDAAAYQVQREVAAALQWFPGGRPRAWKMGAARRGAQPGATPIADQSVRPAPALLHPADFHTMIGIEAELAVRLARPLPPGSTLQQARAAVGEVLAAIEICDLRAREGDPPLPPAYRLADRQVNGWLILGSGRPGPWQTGDEAREVCLEVDGVVSTCRHGGHPLEDPLYLLPWLASHAATQYPDGLQAGDVITTGSWTGVYQARPGQRFHASFAGIGEVSVEIAAD